MEKMCEIYTTFDLSDFEEMQNAALCDTPIQYDCSVLNVTNKCTFFSIIRTEEKPCYKMYYRSYWDPTERFKNKVWTEVSPMRYHNQVTCYSVSDDGVHFRDGTSNKRLGNRNILLCEKSASHNFSPFLSVDNKIYAVGGRNIHQSTIYNHPHPRKCTESIKFIKWKLKTKSQVVRTHGDKKTMTTMVVSDKHYSDCKLNGIHLYNTKDGKNWNLVQKLPIISGLRNGVDINGLTGYATFDSISSVVFNEKINAYILYQRANPKTNQRYISYSTSKDLIRWNKLKILQIENSSPDVDSYYCPYIYKSSGYYIGILPHAVMKNSRYVDGGVMIMLSKDGFRWKRRGHFIDYGYKEDPRELTPKTNLYDKLLYYPVGGSLIESDDGRLTYFYIHNLKDYCVDRYVVRRNGITHIKARDSKNPAIIRTRLIRKVPNGLSLNFSGDIKVELCDEKGDVLPGYSFEECDLLHGDFITKEVSWNKRTIKESSLTSFYLRFHLSPTTYLYSFVFGEGEDLTF